MKILSVFLRNLNSLTGSWSIDFTAKEYAASGIFAITGPTGAGKSTILDAICLALFARTPRLGHISKSSNEIMSRRAGDCFAEVEFETRQGRYRCHWGQHRARRSADGDLQAPRHEMVDARTGKVLETRSKEVGRLVEQVTGMDYDRFTRSILLAQGGFAAFLEADADQRAPILEQITGTGIYSKISVAVHERTSEERKKTAILRETMGSVILLAQEEEAALETRIGEGIVSNAALQNRLAAISEALQGIAAIESLNKQIRATEQLQRELAHRFEQAQGDLRSYELGLKAQSLLGEYTQLQHLRGRITTLSATGEDLRAAMQRLQKDALTLAEDHARACRQLQEAIGRQSQENEVLKTVRALDLRQHENRKASEQVAVTLQQGKAEHQQRLQQRAALEGKLAEITVVQESLATFFREHETDSLLVEHLAGFRQQLLRLQEMDTELTRLQATRTEHNAARAQAQLNADRLQQAAAEAGQRVLSLQQRQEMLNAEMRDLLAGQDSASRRLQIAEAEQRLRELTGTGELLARQHALREEQAVSARALEELQARQQQQQQELQSAEEKRFLQQQLVAELEQNHQRTQRIHSYEEERHQLVDGTPCPLCGATSHPWTDQQPFAGESGEIMSHARAELDRMTTSVSEYRERLVALAKDIEYTAAGRGKQQHQLTELEAQLAPQLVVLGDQEAQGRQAQIACLLEQGAHQLEALRQRNQVIEQLAIQQQEVQKQREQATAQHADLLRQAQAARHAGETVATEIRHMEEHSTALMGQIDLCCRDLGQQLHPLGIFDCPPHQADQLIAALEARQQAWKQQLQKREQLAGYRASLQGERDKEDLLLATIDNTLVQRSAELALLRQEGAGVQEQRAGLYGDRNPDVEEQQLKILVQQAEAREVVTRNRRTEIEKTLHGLAEQQRIGAEELVALLPRSQQQETDFLGRLPAAGFADTASFSSALVPAEALAKLGTLKEQLEKEDAVLTAQSAEQTAALQREEAKQSGQKAAADLGEEQQNLSREQEALQQRIGADRERLAANSDRKKQFAEQQLALAAQQKEQDRWDLLHQLIGSADGKKFRVFAQGLTFDLMISHANRQLRRMNDRYILLRDSKEPLALQVIDNYQAGEIRSTRNLSGGESFLVSLALSLGLSAMASHNVRVDSLFLDEGFGTLDEEALDTALQTLAELQQDGKLIGIISHVPLLKERIDVRIQVLPGANGCSRLVGPGCRKIS